MFLRLIRKVNNKDASSDHIVGLGGVQSWIDSCRVGPREASTIIGGTDMGTRDSRFNQFSWSIEDLSRLQGWRFRISHVIHGLWPVGRANTMMIQRVLSVLKALVKTGDAALVILGKKLCKINSVSTSCTTTFFAQN